MVGKLRNRPKRKRWSIQPFDFPSLLASSSWVHPLRTNKPRQLLLPPHPGLGLGRRHWQCQGATLCGGGPNRPSRSRH
jgi:hypothetical protein